MMVVQIADAGLGEILQKCPRASCIKTSKTNSGSSKSSVPSASSTRGSFPFDKQFADPR